MRRQKAILDRFSEITDRFKHQVPAAGGERGLQRLIEDISAGTVSVMPFSFASAFATSNTAPLHHRPTRFIVRRV
jgi:hypothetical protein